MHGLNPFIVITTPLCSSYYYVPMHPCNNKQWQLEPDWPCLSIWLHSSLLHTLHQPHKHDPHQQHKHCHPFHTPKFLCSAYRSSCAWCTAEIALYTTAAAATGLQRDICSGCRNGWSWGYGYGLCRHWRRWPFLTADCSSDWSGCYR